MYDLFSLGYWPGREKLPRRVLVVEDDRTMEAHLDAAIHECTPLADVTWVLDAEKAQLEMQSTPFDLIIADQKLLGKMTGLDLWHYNQSSQRNTPFILISRYPLRLPRATPEKVQPVFLKKPLRTNRLIKIMSHLLLL